MAKIGVFQGNHSLREGNKINPQGEEVFGREGGKINALVPKNASPTRLLLAFRWMRSLGPVDFPALKVDRVMKAQGHMLML